MNFCFVLFKYSSASYKSHNACITEAAKYGGLNYKAPANANKGQQKQSEWTEVCVLLFFLHLYSCKICTIKILIFLNNELCLKYNFKL